VIRRCFWDPCGSKKIAKEAQNDPTPYIVANTMVQEDSGRHSERKLEDGHAKSHHGLPMVSTTARSGSLDPRSACSFVIIRFWAFSAFCWNGFAYKSLFSQLSWSHPSTILSTIENKLIFLDLSERERIEGEDCKDSKPSLQSTNSSTILAEQISSLLISHFKIHVL